MRVPFDQGTPAPLRTMLGDHVVETAYECGWSMLKNGDLLNAAESAGFAVLVTTDMQLRYQQNLANRHIAIVVLTTTSWPRIRAVRDAVSRAVDGAAEQRYIEVLIP